MLIASDALFNGGWYGRANDGYQHYPFLDRNADAFRGALGNTDLLIAGCAFGYTVQYLTDLPAYTASAYGFDASAWAISQAQAEVPAVAARLMVADALSASDMDAARLMVVGHGARKVPLVVTEDMLPCLTDAEIPAALANLRAISNTLAHIVTLDGPGADHATGLNWKSAAEWRALIGSSEWILNAVTGEVLP